LRAQAAGFFGADLATVQWVLNGYVLALAALTLIGGAADHYGKAHVGCRLRVSGCHRRLRSASTIGCPLRAVWRKASPRPF
jgi:hypothetical protein